MRLGFSLKRLTGNIAFILSWTSLAFLLLLPSGNSAVALLLSVAALAASCFFDLGPGKIRGSLGPVTLLFAAGLDILLAAEYVLQLAGSEGLLLTALEALGLGALALYSLLLVLCLCWSWLSYPEVLDSDSGRKRWDMAELMGAFAAALVILGICSKSSPLYPFNDWGDANCFVTVGKSMLHGLVPYRDLYEQKGPLLYMLHAAAALASERSFIGVFLLELLTGTWFLVLCRRILKLYLPGAGYLWFPVIAAAVFSSKCFFQGDSAEELCLPFYAWALYIGLKSIKDRRLPGARESFALGITSACVLWIKYSMLGLYIGWYAAFVILSLKWQKFPQLLKRTGFIIGGVVAASMPIVLYFVVNSSLYYLWQVYFLDNLFLYSRAGDSGGLPGLVLNLCHGLGNFKNTSPLVFCLMIIGALSLIRSRRHQELVFVLLTFGFSFLLVFVGGRYFVYYSLIFSAFIPVGLVPLAVWTEGLVRRIRPTAAVKISVLPLCVLLSFVLCENTYLLRYEKEELPQFKFAAIIDQKEDASLLNYGFLDGGFYTAAGIVPNCRFFSNLNIPLPDIMETQDSFLEQGKVDYVVTRGQELGEEFDKYVCIDKASFWYEESTQTYYLYSLKAAQDEA